MTQQVYIPRSAAPRDCGSHNQVLYVGDKPFHEGRDLQAGLGVARTFSNPITYWLANW